MVQVSGRTIVALDANGRALKTLVTAYAGRAVRDATLMRDRHTIWYATQALDNATCPEIVKLDLATNRRTVVAHASDFTVTPDRTRLLLVWPKNEPALRAQCGLSVTKQYDFALVVRDVRTGVQSTFSAADFPSVATGSPTGPVWMSAAGDRLVTEHCTNDGCMARTFVVPQHLGTPIILEPPASAPVCNCSTLVSGPEGVYAIDRGAYPGGRRSRLVRFDPASPRGAGIELLDSSSIPLWSVAPTTAGLFVAGTPSGSRTARLYRVDGRRLVEVATLPVGPASPADGFVILPVGAQPV
jgi:hypothetical protein